MNKSAAIWCVIIGCVGMTYQSKSNALRSHSYVVKFTGVAGANVYGNAGWTDANRKIPAVHLDKANSVLPAMTELNPPPGAVVTATGIADEQNQLIIKIYRDGVDCSEEVISGNAGLTSVICRED
jgi:hypothetical protein